MPNSLPNSSNSSDTRAKPKSTNRFCISEPNGSQPFSIEPFRQGDLDAFCGLYALINGLRFAVRDAGINLPNENVLLASLIEMATDLHGSADWAYEGLSGPDLQRFATTIVRYLRSVGMSFEFIKPRSLGTQHLLNRSKWRERFIDSLAKPNTAVLLYIDSEIRGQPAHWSVANGILDDKVMLFDSDGLEHAPLVDCIPWRVIRYCG